MKNWFDSDHVTSPPGGSVDGDGLPGSEAGIPGIWKARLMRLSVLILLIAATYGETLATMIETWWRSETFAHGFLILPISAYLIWKKKKDIASLPLRYEPPMIAVILLLALVWLAARMAHVLVIQQLAVVTMFISAAILILGRHVGKYLSFPLAYLYFMVPMGEFLIPPLQDVTAYIAVRALQLTGIPVYWDGLFFSIPSGSFEVAEACSGIRYLIASLALGTLYAYLMYERTYKRAIFLIFSMVVPVLANGLRAYGIVLLADISDYRLAVGVDHLIYGWLFFGLVISVLFWAGARFRDHPQTIERGVMQISRLAIPPQKSPQTMMLVIAALASVSGPALAHYLERPSPEMFVRPVLPEQFPGFPARKNVQIPDWAPVNKGADERLSLVYEGHAGRLEFYLAYYTHQQQGEELVNINVHHVAKGWVRASQKRKELDLDGGDRVELLELKVTKGEGSKVLYQEYYIDGSYTSDPIAAKLLELRAALSGQPYVLATIMFSLGEDSREISEDLLPGIVGAYRRQLDFTVLMPGEGNSG